MAANPVLAYAGPEAPGIGIDLIAFDGTLRSVRGVVSAAATSPAEAGAAWADAGPLAWVSYAGDPEKIEFVQYPDPVTGNVVHRRVINRERVTGSAGWDTVKLYLAEEARVIADFSAQDFEPEDWNAA